MGLRAAQRKLRRNVRGFSLVELMVGLAVGLFASIAIVQTMSVFENQKRTTTAGSEAQENGLISLTQLEQDVHNAGAGLADAALFDCSTYYTYLDSGPITYTGMPITAFSLAPVTITDNYAASGSDAITIRYTGNFMSSLPAFLATTITDASADLPATRTFGFTSGNLSLLVSGSNCTLFNVSAVDAAASKLKHLPASSSPNLNPATSYLTANSWPTYSANSRIFNVNSLVTHAYSISNQTLQVTEAALNGAGLSIVTRPLISNVVNLQVQYGIAPAGSDTINQWVNATGTTWANPSSANQKRIRAVRIVIVTRASKMESTDVTDTCTTPKGLVANNGPCAWVDDSSTSPAPQIDLSVSVGADWKKYRYKTYQTIIPLRNVIWTNPT